MQPIASNPPIASVYRCEHGGIHLICQNINIGLHPDEFFTLNREVQQAMNLIEAGNLVLFLPIPELAHHGPVPECQHPAAPSRGHAGSG